MAEQTGGISAVARAARVRKANEAKTEARNRMLDALGALIGLHAAANAWGLEATVAGDEDARVRALIVAAQARAVGDLLEALRRSAL